MNINITITTILICLTACNSSKKATTNANASLSGTKWKLIELMGNPISKDDVTTEPFIMLGKKENRVTGNGGCNTFNGSYSSENELSIRFTQMVSTMMACEKMQVEQGLMNVLNQADNYTISGNTLSLNKARMAPLAKFEAVK
jgi:heat shock protein HslJ